MLPTGHASLTSCPPCLVSSVRLKLYIKPRAHEPLVWLMAYFPKGKQLLDVGS